MNKHEIALIKEELKQHIVDCENALHLLETPTLTDQQKHSVQQVIDFIKLKDTHALLSKGEEKKFIGLMDSVPSIAIQGYNIKREVIYWNKSSERIYGYSAEEALGKTLEDLILPEEAIDVVIDLINDWYENGTFIPASELKLKRKDNSVAHVYSSHVMLSSKTGELEMFCVDIDLSEIAQLRDENKNLVVIANKDKLTNTFNRHYFDSMITSKINHCQSKIKSLSLIMFDIDWFKQINDNLGHDVGDKALIALVNIVNDTIRTEDILVRWGGEEFLLLVETEFDNATHLANKLREIIEVKTQELNDLPDMTCSFGVADVFASDSFDDAFKQVDEKLLLAKSNGKNRVEI